MDDLYNMPSMAAGYATARPPVHPRVIDLVREDLHLRTLLDRGLDVGCGAGLSTRALQLIARDCAGIDPSEAMIRCCPAVAPGASFLVGRAELLPVASGSVDIITAAGSLNYADLGLFFAEAARVLTGSGVVVIYDFSPGRSFRGSEALDAWFAEFMRRYPPPPSFGKEVNPDILRDCGPSLRLDHHREFEVGLELAPAAYVDYVLTETNVAAAVQDGIAEAEIRTWCEAALAALFGTTAREILFRGYIAYLVRS
jgi:SAM-dependent methyltransferase